MIPPPSTRRRFSALLDRIENNGVKIMLVEDTSRFARDLVAQEPPTMSITDPAYGVPRPVTGARLYTTPGKRRTEFITDASMKLDLRHDAPRDEPAECVQKYLASAMQSDLMHFVEGPIH